MKILITGGRGLSAHSSPKHNIKSHTVYSYDLVDGLDLLNKIQLNQVVRERCSFHLAAVSDLTGPGTSARNNDHHIDGQINVADACVRIYLRLIPAVSRQPKVHPKMKTQTSTPRKFMPATKLAERENIIRGYGLLTGLR
jgi:nucleoside-diphosphate-sugar epimerase